MDWKGNDGDKYTKRNVIDTDARAKWFNSVLPKDIDSVWELGCNKGHNLEAINIYRNCLVSGTEINPLATRVALKKGLYVTSEMPDTTSDLVLTAGLLIHINPIDVSEYFNNIELRANKYIMFIEHKETSIRTINTRWYKNAMWVMDFGKEFTDRNPEWKVSRQGFVNGGEGAGDYTAPLTDTKTGFHVDDYYWLLKRR